MRKLFKLKTILIIITLLLSILTQFSQILGAEELDQTENTENEVTEIVPYELKPGKTYWLMSYDGSSSANGTIYGYIGNVLDFVPNSRNVQRLDFRLDINSAKDDFFGGSVKLSIVELDDYNRKYPMTPSSVYYSLNNSSTGKHTTSKKADIENLGDSIVVYFEDEKLKASYDELFIICEYSKPWDIENHMEISVNDLNFADSSKETNGLLSGIFNLLTGLLEFLANLPGQIAQAFKGLFDSVLSAISQMAQHIGDMIAQLGDALSSVIRWLWDMLKQALDSIGALLNAIIEGLIKLGQFIIDGLKALFIPSSDYFSKYFKELYDFFNEKLGFLLFPFELFLYIVNAFLGITAGSGIIHIPSIDINDWHIIDATNFNLKETVATALGDKYDLYFMFVDVIIIVLLINYARKMFDEIVGGHSNDS